MGGFTASHGRGRQRTRVVGARSGANEFRTRDHAASGRSRALVGDFGRSSAGGSVGDAAAVIGAFRELHCSIKGNQTLVGRAAGKVFVNSSGNPMLAQGGSGDLLGGYLAGLLAQPQWQAQAITTVRYAVWQHGAAADWLSRRHRNWMVEDLAGAIGSVLGGQAD